jgi:uncharacterized glyoxalase superfamily protein PhnB
MSPEAETTTDHQERSVPETLRARSVSASLTVDDIDASLAWYRDVVGFVVGEVMEREGKIMGAELVAGTARLFIGQDDWAKGRDRDKGQGCRIYLTTAQDIDEVADAIKARGGTLASEPQDMPWGARAFSLEDPDGFGLTISSGSD